MRYRGSTPEWGYPGRLGWTHISDGEILPFIDVNCEGVRLFVQRNLIGLPVPSREAVYGRKEYECLSSHRASLVAQTEAQGQ